MSILAVKERLVERLDPVFAPLTVRMARGMFGTGEMGWMRHIPELPRRRRQPDPWPLNPAPAPAALREYPGSLRDPDNEDAAFAAKPLKNFNRAHSEAVMWLLGRSWTWLLAPYPKLRRALDAIDAARNEPAAPHRVVDEPADLSARIRDEARRLGISEVGFAHADRRYTFEGVPDPAGKMIIVCLLEQPWAPTQTIPSSKAERAALRTYGDLAERVAALVRFVHTLGFEATPNDWGSLDAIAIHYAVEAGLGQLGLNGQLLTPAAGSRCRLGLITTTAAVAAGSPIDFGIPAVCDACQVCVKRCPSGAIPIRRTEKRGVTKASIKPERCFPIVAQAHGCGVCMKVCPVQRFGLPAVVARLQESGTILGKGDDELEGYDWPLDGRHYGPGEKPPITAQLISPPGWVFDPSRTA